jgi:hypothetical protein
MKKLILTALLVAGTSLFAQERAEVKRDNPQMQERKMSPEQRVAMQTKRMTADLGLDEKQSKQVQELLLEENKKREALRAEMEAKRASGIKPTPEEKEAFKATIQDEKKNMDEKMKAILSPEQFDKWQVKRELKRDEAIDKRAEKLEKRIEKVKSRR